VVVSTLGVLTRAQVRAFETIADAQAWLAS
jgi:hypothetical protein